MCKSMFAEDKSKVEMIPTDRIRRNPENPRIIFDEAKMEILMESIHSVGILVPLIVYRDTEPGRYVLLDGERRWRCAQNLNLPEVPANVIPTPTRLENILRMFNIHNVREAWTITETAWKLSSVIELVENETGKRPTEKLLTTLTGLTISGIRRCKKLLAFPDEFQKMVHEGRIKSDFLIEMRARVVQWDTNDCVIWDEDFESAHGSFTSLKGSFSLLKEWQGVFDAFNNRDMINSGFVQKAFFPHKSRSKSRSKSRGKTTFHQCQGFVDFLFNFYYICVVVFT